MEPVVLEGKLASTPSMSQIDGRLVARFTLHTSTIEITESGPFRQYIHAYEVLAYGELARICQRLKTTSTIRVKGQLRTISQEQDGQQHTRTEVVAARICVDPWLWGEDDEEYGEDEEDENEIW